MHAHEQLTRLDFLEEAIERVSVEIVQRLRDEYAVIALLNTLPGVSQRTAQILVAEIGTDLSRFPSAKHLASWAGVCPATPRAGGDA